MIGWNVVFIIHSSLLPIPCRYPTRSSNERRWRQKNEDPVFVFQVSPFYSCKCNKIFLYPIPTQKYFSDPLTSYKLAHTKSYNFSAFERMLLQWSITMFLKKGRTIIWRWEREKWWQRERERGRKMKRKPIFWKSGIQFFLHLDLSSCIDIYRTLTLRSL